jgi:hypothetical protein
MSKTLDANQTQKVDRRFLQPIYLVHILNVGAGAETLYFSDRTFTYNGHNYEDYLMDLPSLAQSIERFGGFLNINAQLTFKNQKFRASNTVLEWFDLNPITRKELELYVLYIDTGETFGSDVSTKLCRLGIGEFRSITRQTFQAEFCTITHLLDQKNILYRINTTDWPNADPKVVGQVANIVYGEVKDIPCHCVKTGAYSTLQADMTTVQVNIPLSEVEYPITFPATGSVFIEDEQIKYTGVNTTTRKLTGCVRGYNATTAAIHKIGTPALAVLANYKWMVAGHQMKSVDAIKLDRVVIPVADYTVNLNDGGRTTVQFSSRQILKHQGAHGHPMTAIKEIWPTSGVFAPQPCDTGWNIKGNILNLFDKNEETYMSVKAQGTLPPPINNYVTFKMNFPAYTGQKANKIFACIQHASQYTTATGAYVRMTNPIAVDLDPSNAKKTQRIRLAGTTMPTSLKIRAQFWGGYPDFVIVATCIYNIWIEIELAETGSAAASGVFGAMDDVFAPLVTADGQGYKDATGVYTGIMNALIENPSDARRHFLIAVLGRVAGDLYTTDFDDMRTLYAARVAGGYKIATLLNQISEIPSEILARLDLETRSTLREDGGLYHLSFNEAAAPSSVLTITQDDIYGEPVFGQTAIDDVRNKLRCMYDKDWAGSLASNRYLSNFMQSLEVPDPTSITKYGELAEDIEFQTCKKATMVDDVADWIISQKKDVLKTVSLTVSHVARILEKGDYFILTWIFWTGLKWRVLSIEETPGQQAFRIEAVQYPV